MTSTPDSNSASGLTSRRAFVGGVGAGVFAALSPTAIAQAGGAKPSRASAADAAAAREENFPKPPFKKQTQPWPGLARDMTPRPDHGERSYRGSGRLAGRRALVTGGDSGIGRAAAIAFAREGADVAVNYLPAEEPDAREVVELIRAEGRKAVALPGEITDEEFCRRLVADAVRELGGLDLLVNNAAYQQSVDALADLTSEQFDRTMKTNVYAPFWITKAALPHLGRGAAIINTASVQAYEPSENLLDYAQTKSANVAFTKSLARQLAAKGVRVNAVAPGPFWTPLQVSGGQSPEALTSFGEKTPLGRPGQPAELAPTYVLLAAGESSYTTGQVIGAAGGSGNP